MKNSYYIRSFKALSRQAPVVVLVCILFAALTEQSATGQEQHSPMETRFDQARPRAVEPLTAQSVVRDYDRAWANLIAAFGSDSPELLNGYFSGPAKTMLLHAVAAQAHTGIRLQYLDPAHKLEAIFYSPEGDVMELHDTVEFDLRMIDNGRIIRDQRTTMRFIVLMTPEADRWVVRQLQSVSQF